jgi:hypothetical protein
MFTKVVAQDSIQNVLSKYSYSFSIKNGRIAGTGADYFVEKMKQCQFVLIGENHGSSQMGNIMTILIPLLSENGFSNLAIEVGPVSASKLQKMDNPGDIKAFNKKYYNGRYPIPFFTGVEDEKYLTAALLNKWKIWGLDQEFNNANEFLFDELLNTAKGSGNYSELIQLRDIAYGQVLQIKKNSSNADSSLLKDSLILKFFNAFNPDNKRATEIISALRKSWEIYSLYAQKKYNKNNTERAEYMKANFLANYNTETNNKQFPKVLVKLGHGHVTIGKSPLGVEDVGMMLHQLALKNNTKILHIAQRQRYVKGPLGLKQDYIKYSRDIAPVLKLARKKEWVIIDLQEFRRNHPDIQLDKGMKKEISQFDILLLTPVDRRVRKNR